MYNFLGKKNLMHNIKHIYIFTFVSIYQIFQNCNGIVINTVANESLGRQDHHRNIVKLASAF